VLKTNNKALQAIEKYPVVLTYAPDDMKASFECISEVGMGRRIRLPRRAVRCRESMTRERRSARRLRPPN